MKTQSNPFCLILVLSWVVATPALAQLELGSSTADGGGGTSTGGSFEVSGTAGQFDAGILSGGTFDLEGGFWTSVNPAVPVELQSFEVVSRLEATRGSQLASVAAGPACRQGARLPETRPVRIRRDKTTPSGSEHTDAPRAAEDRWASTAPR